MNSYMVKVAINNMEADKAVSLAGIVIKRQDIWLRLLVHIVSQITVRCVIPSGLYICLFIDNYSSKGEALERSKCRDIKSIDQVMKDYVYEHNLLRESA